MQMGFIAVSAVRNRERGNLRNAALCDAPAHLAQLNCCLIVYYFGNFQRYFLNLFVAMAVLIKFDVNAVTKWVGIRHIAQNFLSCGWHSPNYCSPELCHAYSVTSSHHQILRSAGFRAVDWVARTVRTIRKSLPEQIDDPTWVRSLFKRFQIIHGSSCPGETLTKGAIKMELFHATDCTSSELAQLDETQLIK